VHKTKNGIFSVGGAFAGVEDIESMKIIEGRSINALDTKERRKVVLIGQRVQDQLFVKGEKRVGRDTHHQRHQLPGDRRSESLQQGNQQQEDEKIYLPNDTLRYAFNQTGGSAAS
jgi:putative ABC transport system permease protein